jgi:pheophorbide a oxygenase
MAGTRCSRRRPHAPRIHALARSPCLHARTRSHSVRVCGKPARAVRQNIVDPSHIPFAHHGLQGKREDAIAINMSVPETLGAAGLRFAFGDRTMGMLRSGHGEFRAPFVVQYNASYPASPRTFNLTVVCVPTAPGWSRAIIFGGTQPEARKAQANAGGSKPKRSLFATIFGLLPTWAIHLGSNRFLDSDLAFLHFQEQTLRERAAGMGEGVGLAERAGEYFMPAPADRVIVALHRWLDEYAHVPGPLPPPIRTRAALFDRWTQHTAHCRHCQAAVAGIARWRGRLGVGLGLCLLAAASHWAARLLGVACLGGLGLLGLVEQQFRVSDYKHYKT